MNVRDVLDAMQKIAPLEYAAEWDNVGLLAGSSQWKVSSLLLTIDLTQAVLREAIDSKVSMIVSYHPPIFAPMKSITDFTVKEQIILDALTERIAIYSPHTALDAAPEGVNDWLASAFGEGDVRALQSHATLPESEQCKIVTFCPAEAVDIVRNGLASVGVGRIGNYQLCSFEVDGRGTFLAGEGANPTVGKKGTLNRVNEIRLEMVCPKASLGLAVIALREFHPYEEPPLEIIALQPRPQRNIGQGRRVTLVQPESFRALIERIKRKLSVRQVHVAMGDGHGPHTKIERIGLCAGAGGSLLDAAIKQGCQLFCTGEMRHHDVLDAQSRGCTVVLAGHTNTERGYLKVLRRRLIAGLPDVRVVISKRDGDPLRIM